MNFCDVCENILYDKLDDTGKLVHHCNYCSMTYDNYVHARVVSETHYRDDRAKYHHLLTPLIHEDPTLPRVSSVPCPNKHCKRPADALHRVVYIKYDPRNMKYIYSCSYCHTFWGPAELKNGYNPAEDSYLE
jgi:DNA-directed RNA polymerase subunit M/transcription elongation factor TFIIS